MTRTALWMLDSLAHARCPPRRMGITLYLGGFNGPVLFGMTTASHIFWLLAKFAILVVFIILIRCVFPRLRLDQMLHLGWRTLTPLAVLNLAIVLALKLLRVY